MGCYLVALVHLLRALAIADTVRSEASHEREAQLTELDAHHKWLELRAIDNPGSFRHLAHLVAAERAWALGDNWAALSFFERSLRHAAAQRRPWHRAFICERTGRFLLASGMRYSGRALLQEARQRYSDWGATGKVRRLEQNDRIRANTTADRQGASSGLSFDRIDLLAILRASQALGSETSLRKLRFRVEEVLSALTGATKVNLALYDDATRRWHLVPVDEEVAAIPIDVAAERGLLPISAFRFAQGSSGHTVIEDATADNRFARDPYFANVECCSLLLMSVQSHGLVRAILILENHLTRGAFSNVSKLSFPWPGWAINTDGSF